MLPYTNQRAGFTHVARELRRSSHGPIGAHALDVLIVELGGALELADLGVDVRDGAVRVGVAHVVAHLAADLQHTRQVLDRRPVLALRKPARNRVSLACDLRRPAAHILRPMARSECQERT